MSWLLVPLAFIAMFAQDVLGVLMVRAEGSGRAHRAASCDVLQDACALASLGAVGGSLLVGSDVLLSAAVIAARLAGDYAGTYSGVRFGVRLDSKEGARVGHLLMHFFGLDDLTGPQYGFWSGVGSDISELAIVGAVLGAFRKHNCHEPRCWRIGRHSVDGTPWCDRHHQAARNGSEMK